MNNSCQALPIEGTFIFLASPSQVYHETPIPAQKIATLGFSERKGYVPCHTSEGPGCSLFCGGRDMNWLILLLINGLIDILRGDKR